jgi:WD40 repeat protein
VYDVWHQKLVEIIRPEEAHNAPIACMAFSPNGDKLATACSMGTLILVFSTPGKQILFQCRRGQMYVSLLSAACACVCACICPLLLSRFDHRGLHFTLHASRWCTHCSPYTRKNAQIHTRARTHPDFRKLTHSPPRCSNRRT